MSQGPETKPAATPELPPSLLVRETAEAIRALVTDHSGNRLPSVRALSRSLSVSLGTVLKSIRLLIAEGLLESRPRERIVIRGRANAVATGQVGNGDDPAKLLAEKLRNRIRDRALRPLEPLPKTSVLASEERVSASTVTAAMRQLAAEKWIHKQGRSWKVGRGLEEVERRDSGRPTILIIQPTPVHWGKLRGGRTLPFTHAFGEESERLDVPCLGCSLRHFSRFDVASATGLPAILALARALGPLYRGSLVVGLRRDYAELDVVLRALGGLGRPVLWLDQKEDPGEFPVSPLISRAHFPESAFSLAALAYLRTLGHRTIGFVGRKGIGPEWEHQRERLCHEAAPSLGCRVVGYLERHKELQSLDDVQLEALLHRARESRQAGVRKAAGHFLAHAGAFLPARRKRTPGSMGLALRLWPDVPDRAPQELWHLYETMILLLDESITALILANDALGYRLLPQLRRMGFDIPGDISLIGHDHGYQSMELPLDTISPGADTLGYRCFHHLLGDLPESFLNRGERGWRGIPAEPRVISRGSTMTWTRIGSERIKRVIQ